jgi:hypothetical protein
MRANPACVSKSVLKSQLIRATRHPLRTASPSAASIIYIVLYGYAPYRHNPTRAVDHSVTTRCLHPCLAFTAHYQRASSKWTARQLLTDTRKFVDHADPF